MTTDMDALMILSPGFFGDPDSDSNKDVSIPELSPLDTLVLALKLACHDGQTMNAIRAFFQQLEFHGVTFRPDNETITFINGYEQIVIMVPPPGYSQGLMDDSEDNNLIPNGQGVAQIPDGSQNHNRNCSQPETNNLDFALQSLALEGPPRRRSARLHANSSPPPTSASPPPVTSLPVSQLRDIILPPSVHFGDGADMNQDGSDDETSPSSVSEDQGLNVQHTRKRRRRAKYHPYQEKEKPLIIQHIVEGMDGLKGMVETIKQKLSETVGVDPEAISNDETKHLETSTLTSPEKGFDDAEQLDIETLRAITTAGDNANTDIHLAAFSISYRDMYYSAVLTRLQLIKPTSKIVPSKSPLDQLKDAIGCEHSVARAQAWAGKRLRYLCDAFGTAVLLIAGINRSYVRNLQKGDFTYIKTYISSHSLEIKLLKEELDAIVSEELAKIILTNRCGQKVALNVLGALEVAKGLEFKQNVTPPELGTSDVESID